MENLVEGIPVDEATGEIYGVRVDEPTARRGRRVRLFIDPQEKRTKESQAEETDINVIMRRASQTGFISHLSSRQPWYGDVSEFPKDLAEARRVMDAAVTSFESLPSAVRARFENDPAKFFDYFGSAMTPEKEKELVDLGMLPKPVVASEPPGGASATPPAS